ncbi:MAG: radical SAM family heme chaperone HemW [Papillibacter sp.]|jgi:oxygen-independent coproporphyrinogen-3 oxidase|nr:radical SAM family heme chaperone HemW [Papillibacter sp.]
MQEKKIGIYIHLPFCASRCQYCDFCSSSGKDELIPAYQEALITHIHEFAPRLDNYLIDTVYFGGGTPSYYGAKNLIKLLDELKKSCHVLVDSEITLEANPDSTTLKDLKLLRREGFNRISYGAQSANNAILRFIGRRHTWEQTEQAVKDAGEAGFTNISLDLMYGLPAQSREDWSNTLTSAVKLGCQHLSCYGLKLEENTPLYMYKNSPNMPDEDMQADMYLYTVDALLNAGYLQYEISNFALKGFESKHNLKYWLLDEYLGFGASASSFMGGRRFTYINDIERYISAVSKGEGLISELEDVSLYEQSSEYIMLGMRTNKGIDSREYESRYQNSFKPLEELLEGYAKMGLARRIDSRWHLTPRGFLLSNRLIGELLDAQAEHKFHIGMPWRKEDYYETLY